MVGVGFAIYWIGKETGNELMCSGGRERHVAEGEKTGVGLATRNWSVNEGCTAKSFLIEERRMRICLAKVRRKPRGD